MEQKKITLNFVTPITASINLTEEEIEQIVTDSISRFDLTENLLIEILFVDEQEIQELNVKHRNIDKPTDVLSFPQTQIPGNRLNILGSLVICHSMVQKKEEDLKDVIKHGLLHLLGYDHEVNEAEWEVAAKKINCQL